MRFIKRWMENKAEQSNHYTVVEVYLEEILKVLKGGANGKYKNKRN